MDYYIFWRFFCKMEPILIAAMYFSHCFCCGSIVCFLFFDLSTNFRSQNQVRHSLFTISMENFCQLYFEKYNDILLEGIPKRIWKNWNSFFIFEKWWKKSRERIQDGIVPFIDHFDLPNFRWCVLWSSRLKSPDNSSLRLLYTGQPNLAN